MKIPKEPLYFVGHQGLVDKLGCGQGRIMYIPDANLVLKLLQKGTAYKDLRGKHKEYLSVSRESVSKHWHRDKEWIPVNPLLALMELSKQHQHPDFAAYLSFHNQFFTGLYGISDVAPEWVVSTYIAAMRAHISTHPSMSKTVQKALSLIPPADKPSNTEVLAACEDLLNWMWHERDRLVIIGGPLLYICVYAIAGSPNARRFIKYSKAAKGHFKSAADNVAWDMLYWIMLEIEYHRNAYQDTIVCTSDRSLADLLSSRVNKGPRGQTVIHDGHCHVESFGDLYSFKLSKLEDTKLEREIARLLFDLFSSLDLTNDDSIRFGFNEL
jgi:hypothetical protein